MVVKNCGEARYTIIAAYFVHTYIYTVETYIQSVKVHTLERTNTSTTKRASGKTASPLLNCGLKIRPSSPPKHDGTGLMEYQERRECSTTFAANLIPCLATSLRTTVDSPPSPCEGAAAAGCCCWPIAAGGRSPSGSRGGAEGATGACCSGASAG